MKKPIQIGDWEAPPGVCLVGNAYLMHHDADIYPDPYVFRPERFVEEAPGHLHLHPLRRRPPPLPRRELRDGGDAAGDPRDPVAVRPARRLRRRRRARAATQHHRPARGGRPGRAPRAKAGARSGVNDRAQMVTDTVRGMRRLGWFSSALGALVVFTSVGFLIPVFLDPARQGRARPAQRAAGDRLPARLRVSSSSATSAGATPRRCSGSPRSAQPDEREHRRTLHLAVYNTKMAGLAWAGGAVLFMLAQRLRLRLGLRRVGRRHGVARRGDHLRALLPRLRAGAAPGHRARAGGAPAERHDRARRAPPAVRRLGAGHRRAAARGDRGRRRGAHASPTWTPSTWPPRSSSSAWWRRPPA